MKRLAIAAAMVGTFMAAPAFAEEAAPAASAPAQAHFSTSETPLGELMDNAATRAVIDAHLPEVAADPRLEMARGMTLKSLQPFAAELTDEKLAQIDADLANIHP